MRLIDAEYLLYGLGMFSEKENGAEFIKGVDAVADMIESAETISPAANWTPCSVELPDENFVYQVTVEYPNGARFVCEDKFRKCEGWQSECFSQRRVVAWMKRTEPYRGEA